MRYADPVTGKLTAKSTGTHLKREAERAAAKWEAELREGRYKPASKISWEEFTERHRDEAQSGLAEKTVEKFILVFTSLETELGIKKLSDLTEARISKWQNALRNRELSEQTIKSYSAHLKSALNRAFEVEIIASFPRVSMPKRAKAAKVMKGRAITAEEFDRMIQKVSKVVGDDRSADWRHFLRGLWWSGLRLSEALELTWDGNGLRVELIGKEPFLMIPANSQKSNVARLLPIAPEFADILLSVPDDDGVGFVFNLPMARNHNVRRTDSIGKVVTDMGLKANVVVDRFTRAGKGVTKFASAHDLRRAFGTRWASLLMPADLQTLVRHSSIQTTMKFYVTKDAQDLTKRLRTAIGDTSGDTRQKPDKSGDTKEAATH